MALARLLSLERISFLAMHAALFLETTFFWYWFYANVAAGNKDTAQSRDFWASSERPRGLWCG